ncbi:MAG: hypothetical protein MJ252_12005 [archaeon]|nr:hypothetical protein [archaeon]
MFYNTYRTTKSAMAQRQQQSRFSKAGSNIVNPKERLINLQKREKLKGLLITKFMKKYGINHPEKILEDEITKFLQGEKLNDADLQRLDAKIHRLLLEKKNKEDLKSTLTQNMQPGQTGPINEGEPQSKTVQFQSQPQFVSEQPLAATQCAAPQKVPTPQRSAATAPYGSKRNAPKYKSPEEELAELEAEEAAENAKQHYERLDFAGEGDEWAAMAKYNKKLFEEEQINERLKDQEIKRRTKEDLDNQIKQKIKREYEESLIAKEQDKMLLEHLKKIDEMEKEKKEKLKAQVLREKQNRDVQMKDAETRKRIEALKEKKFDRQLIKHINEDIEKDRLAAIEKKKKENEALKQTLKDNELHKIKMAELAQKEREDDIRTCKENAMLEEKRENERKKYFKDIENKMTNFMSGTAKQTLDEMDRINKEEEEKQRQFMLEKERREVEEEERRKQEERENKINMRKYLQMQIDEKNKMKEFEKMMDSEQARIWNVDSKKYIEDEKVINQKIKKMNKRNLDSVMNQIKAKKEREANAKKMSPTEYAMNRKTLEAAKEKISA